MATAPAYRHAKRGTVIPIRHDGYRLVGTLPALERFKSYCKFDPTTGCVLWTGGTTQGRGHHAPYGAFWFEGRRWAAHRWSAKHIHGQDIDERQVDHNCDLDRAGPGLALPPNTLCVQHVKAIPGSENRALQTERQTWILTQKGIYEPPPLFVGLEAPMAGSAPFYEPPRWLLDATVNGAQDNRQF